MTTIFKGSEYKKMFNITRLEKYNSKPQDNTSHTLGWLLSKQWKILSAGNDMENLEHLYTVGRDVNGRATVKKFGSYSES